MDPEKPWVVTVDEVSLVTSYDFEGGMGDPPDPQVKVWYDVAASGVDPSDPYAWNEGQTTYASDVYDYTFGTVVLDGIKARSLLPTASGAGNFAFEVLDWDWFGNDRIAFCPDVPLLPEYFDGSFWCWYDCPVASAAAVFPKDQIDFVCFRFTPK
jgi:hypothetical protein